MIAEEESIKWAVAVILGVVTVVVLLRVLGRISLGSRRQTTKLVEVKKGEGYSILEHETGLIQQWYSDQPCQRIYSLVLSAAMSAHGVSRLSDKGHVTSAVRALTSRHPVLRTTITRDSTSSRASVLIANVDDSVEDEKHPWGGMPVSYVPRVNEGTWQDVVQQLTHTDMNESKWLFRIVIVMNNDPKQSKTNQQHAQQVEIVLIVHHFLNDGKQSSLLFLFYGIELTVVYIGVCNRAIFCNTDERFDSRFSCG